MVFSDGYAAAVPLLERAVELDSQFAIAHAALVIRYSNLGESVLSRASTSKAYELRDRTSERERSFITTMYNRLCFRACAAIDLK